MGDRKYLSVLKLNMYQSQTRYTYRRRASECLECLYMHTSICLKAKICDMFKTCYTLGVTGIFFWGGKVIFPNFFSRREKIPFLVHPKPISVVLKSEKKKKKKRGGVLTYFCNFSSFHFQFFHLSFFDFNFFLLHFPNFPCLSFPDTSDFPNFPCLSFPDTPVKISRSAWSEVSGAQWRSQGLTGWASRPPGGPKWGRQQLKFEEK